MNQEDREYLEKCLGPISKDVEDIKTQVRINMVELNQRVTFKAFFAIIGLLMTISLGVSGYIATQIHDLQAKTYVISQEVGRIGGYLEQIDFVKLD